MSTPAQWRLVHEVYAAASQLDSSQRSAFLDRECPDPIVRHEVERMLSSALELQPGIEFGHYKVQSKLGAGGMGSVYQALDRNLNRVVAIKIMSRAEFGGEDSRRRFAREAQAISALNHPNIVTIYEVGCQQGRDFIAMERVEGKTLDAAIPSAGSTSTTRSATRFRLPLRWQPRMKPASCIGI